MLFFLNLQHTAFYPAFETRHRHTAHYFSAGVFEVRLMREPRSLHTLPLTIIAPAEPGTLREEFTITIMGEAEPITLKAHCKVAPSTAARP